MRKIFVLLTLSASFLFALSACRTAQKPIAKETSVLTHTGSIGQLQKYLYVLASDSLEGRCTATEGQKKAAVYLANEMEKCGLKMIANDTFGNPSWFQTWPFVKRFGDTKKYMPHSENVIGLLPATVQNNEYLVISAHYDHLGIIKDSIYNGADDNGTGTAAVLEMMRMMSGEMKLREKNVLFIFFSGEEKGLLGSKFFSENPVVPMESIICNLNIDMVGRADSAHALDSHFVYVIGSDRIAPQLDSLVQLANAKGPKPLNLDYKYNDPEDPQRLYQRSDHYNFAKHGIPVAFFFSGLHPDYHRPSDDIEHINFELLHHRMMLVYRVAEEVIKYKGSLLGK